MTSVGKVVHYKTLPFKLCTPKNREKPKSNDDIFFALCKVYCSMLQAIQHRHRDGDEPHQQQLQLKTRSVVNVQKVPGSNIPGSNICSFPRHDSLGEIKYCHFQKFFQKYSCQKLVPFYMINIEV